MNLLELIPQELEQVVNSGVPAVLAVGVTEYHGPHLPIGTDFFIAEMLVREIEKRIPVVIVPGITFGPTMHWAGGIKEGDIDFCVEAMSAYAKEVMKKVSAIGFRRIFVVQFHAGSDGLQFLALKKAAAELLQEESGNFSEGWGREKDAGRGFFGKFRIFNLESMYRYAESKGETIDFTHAGPGETEWIMNYNQKLVKLDKLTEEDGNIEWLRDSRSADIARGKKHIELCVEYLCGQIKK